MVSNTDINRIIPVFLSLFLLSGCTFFPDASVRVSSSSDIIDYVIKDMSDDNLSIETDVDVCYAASVLFDGNSYDEAFTDSSHYSYSDGIIKESLHYNLESSGYSGEIYEDYLHDTSTGESFITYTDYESFFESDNPMYSPSPMSKCMSSLYDSLSEFSLDEDGDVYVLESSVSYPESQSVWCCFNGNADCSWASVFIPDDCNENQIPSVDIAITIDKESTRISSVTYDLSDIYVYYLNFIYGLDEDGSDSPIELTSSTCEMTFSYGNSLGYVSPLVEGSVIS